MSQLLDFPAEANPGHEHAIGDRLSGDSARDLADALSPSHQAAMLYGSQARGDARPDSDVDVLQVVSARPRPLSLGRVNVTSYSEAHLRELAVRGSLFIRHLRDEGVIVCDHNGLLSGVLAAYREPLSYHELKSELRVVLHAFELPHSGNYGPGVSRISFYAVRSALYIAAAEKHKLVFDVEEASRVVGCPFVGAALRRRDESECEELRRCGIRLLNQDPPQGAPSSLEGVAVWASGEFPVAARLLEHVIAGDCEIDYGTLTLPLI